MLLNPLTFHSPQTLEELLQLYKTLPNVKLKAGGTFLLNTLKLLKRNGAKTPDNVISLSRVGELKGIEKTAGALNIRSMTTIDEIFDSPLLESNLKVLRTVCRNISTQPIRNMATIGGNLTCRYTWTEMPAVTIGLGATLHFLDEQLKNINMPAEDFYRQDAKTSHILARVSFPFDPGTSVAYRRVKKTSYVDIPLLSLIITTTFRNKEFSGTRVAVNNCVTFAQRDKKLEGFLDGRKCSAGLAEEALDHLEESIYDTRSTEYKSHMFRVSIKSALNELVESQHK